MSARGEKYLRRGLVPVRGQAVHPKREVAAARLDGSRPLGHAPAQLSPAFLVRGRVRGRVRVRASPSLTPTLLTQTSEEAGRELRPISDPDDGHVVELAPVRACIRRDSQHLECHGARYSYCMMPARGWYARPVRTVSGRLGARDPAPLVRTARVASTYPTTALGRRCQRSAARGSRRARGPPRCGSSRARGLGYGSGSCSCSCSGSGSGSG